MSLIAVISLISLIAISTSTQIDGKPPMYSFAIQDQWRLLVQEAFLLSAAALGASFSALFKANSYVKDASFEPRYITTYWIRFVLGVIAGFILAMMIPLDNFVQATGTVANTAEPNMGAFAFGGMLHPLLALLGGYSASLVYRILDRLVIGLETIFKGSVDEQAKSYKQNIQAQFDINKSNQRIETLGKIQNILSDTNLDEKGLREKLSSMYDTLSRAK